MNSADYMEAHRWLQKTVNELVDQKLKQMGIPRLFVPGVIQSITTTNGKTFANVYLNGSSTASTNIPVNPDIVTNLSAGTPVWVFNINFHEADRFVAMRKLA